MRMFYAIKFADYVKESLFVNLTEIKKHIMRGSFTEKNNFHITLVFVGECEPDKIESLKKAADNAVNKLNPNLSPVNAVIDGLGTFARPGDELLWAGVKTEPENKINILREINNAVIGELADSEIKINDGNKKFTPHVTIARRVQFREISGKDVRQITFTPIDFTIDSLTLMESVQEITAYGEKKYTKIIYKPVYEVKF